MLNFVISCSGRQGRCALGCLRLMRTFTLLGCFVGVNGASSPEPSPAPPVETVIRAIQSVSFHSAALGQTMNYQVLLPAGYA